MTLANTAKVYVQRAIDCQVGSTPLGDALRSLVAALASSSTSIVSQPDLTSLATIDTVISVLASGSEIYVLTVKDYYTLDTSDLTTPVDGITVLAATPVGRWRRQELPNEYWQAQSVWNVNTITGNDENNGLGSPIKTLAEYARRTGQVFEPNQFVLVNITGTSTDKFYQKIVSHNGLTVTFRGQLPVSTAGVIASVQAPDCATQKQPQITIVGAWASLTAKMLHFTVNDSWSFAFDNDGVSTANVLFPAQGASLPMYAGAGMPAPGDPVAIYEATAMPVLGNAVIEGVSDSLGFPAVIVETLGLRAAHFDGAVLFSRIYFATNASDVDITGSYPVMVLGCDEITNGNALTFIDYFGVLASTFFRFALFTPTGVALIDTQWQRVELAGNALVFSSLVLVDAFAAGTGNLDAYDGYLTINGALWGTASSNVHAVQDVGIYIVGGSGPTTFRPATIQVGRLGGIPVPALIPGAVVPANPGCVNPVQLEAAPYLGTACDYSKNARITTN